MFKNLAKTQLAFYDVFNIVSTISFPKFSLRYYIHTPCYVFFYLILYYPAFLRQI